MFQKVECPSCSGWDKREKNFKSERELGALSSTGSSNGESWRGKEMSSLGHERCHTAWHSTSWVQNIRHLPGTDGRASSNNSQGRILSKCILGFGLEAATVNYTLAVRVQKGTVPSHCFSSSQESFCEKMHKKKSPPLAQLSAGEGFHLISNITSLHSSVRQRWQKCKYNVYSSGLQEPVCCFK